MEEEHAITPGVLGLIALLSIGGILFVGWEAQLVGKAVGDSYPACCTSQSWQRAPTGFISGTAQTKTEFCSPSESVTQCCSRASAARSEQTVRLLGGRRGSCVAPEVSYPVNFGGRAVCCTMNTWQHSPTGFTQGIAKTATEYCAKLETISQCCLRSGAERYDYPVRMLGFREGSCAPTVPERSFPVWIR